MRAGFNPPPSALPLPLSGSLAKAQKQGLNENPPPVYGAAEGYHLLGDHSSDHKEDSLPPFKPSPHVSSQKNQPPMPTPSAPPLHQIQFYPPPPSYAEATAKKGDNQHPKYQNVTYTQYYGSGTSSTNFYIYYMDGYEVHCAAQLMEFQIELLSSAAKDGMHLTSELVSSLHLSEGMSLVGRAGLEAINFTVGAAGQIARGLIGAAHAVAEFDATCCSEIGHSCCVVGKCVVHILPTICSFIGNCLVGCCEIFKDCECNDC